MKKSPLLYFVPLIVAFVTYRRLGGGVAAILCLSLMALFGLMQDSKKVGGKWWER